MVNATYKDKKDLPIINALYSLPGQKDKEKTGLPGN